ncbi:MAG: hypothetical protein JO249_16640, partial [Acidobacteria bacterium]|nr:hypothetical protein [Acidobacteriota bacterium]
AQQQFHSKENQKEAQQTKNSEGFPPIVENFLSRIDALQITKGEVETVRHFLPSKANCEAIAVIGHS